MATDPTPEENLTHLTMLPLGGLGEIGMNMMAFAWGADAFLVDAGLLFPDDSMPGVDLVIPDLDGLLNRGWNIRGIVLTHGHEDHIGALPYVLEKIEAPVYATSLTMGLVENKLAEFDLLGSTERHVISPRNPIELGPFRVDFFSMCHSVPDGVGLAVTTPAGVVIHSGDFKFDPEPIDGRYCDVETISAYARQGVLALLSDSTNVEREGTTGSERSIRPELEKIFRRAKGRILVATFASNIHRMQQIFDLSEELGRQVVLVGRSMEANAAIASERGYLRIPRGILVDMKELDALPDDRVTILSTGSQGEPLSTLSLMAFDRHKYLKAKPGDLLVLSSRFIPGNEKAINTIINEFCRRGADVEYEGISHVHVSGHAQRDELRALIRLVQPRYFIPAHGEYRHLRRHARLAKEEGIPEERVLVLEDGDLVELSWDKATVLERLPLKRVFVDGKGVGDVGNEVLRDRRVLSEVGMVIVAIAIAKETGEIVSGPEVFSRGVTYQDTEPELIDGTRKAVEAVLADLDPRTSGDWEEAREQIRLAARRHVNRSLGRRPVVQTLVLEV